MGTIAGEFAYNLAYKIDSFVMALAFGAGSDLPSPIGHQSNTLVMGPGGYHFADYWKLGTAVLADRCRGRRSFDPSILAAGLNRRN
jgi:di/tricarboxylate transporter